VLDFIAPCPTGELSPSGKLLMALPEARADSPPDSLLSPSLLQSSDIPPLKDSALMSPVPKLVPPLCVKLSPSLRELGVESLGLLSLELLKLLSLEEDNVL